MTTKPKAKKYRIRRGSSLNVGSTSSNAARSVVGSDVSDAREVATEQSIDDIRKEGLT
ncbi:MAG TPA: capsule biosynthesis protein, partial [Rhodobacteraceae bacterium]|nr:capsule biosynthesis protein [Paracoccaceae bacterium]